MHPFRQTILGASRIVLALCLLLPLTAVHADPRQAPSQPLADALLDVAERWPAIKLVFRPELLEGLETRTVLAVNDDPEQALRALLEGQPLRLRQLSSGVYVVEPAAIQKTMPPKPAPAPTVSRVPRQAPAQQQLMEELVTIGTRSRNRRWLHSTVPVDVVQGAALERSAPASLGEQLQMQVPSFNFSRTMVSDGADLVRPATLRGMNPDQLLVMVDGKRRHHQAQINIQQVVGRGSSGVDMNAVPTAAIEVEVLRDGASAQYGSDAIAGVLNLQLKRGEQAPVVNAQYGLTGEGDGQSLIASVAGGSDLGSDASLFVTFEGQDRAATNRAGPDSRFTPPRTSMRIGDAEQQSWTLFANGQWALSDLAEVYAFGGSSRRQGLSAGFYRAAGAQAGQPAVSSRYVPALDPEGFLPLQTTRTEDDAFTLGLEWMLGEGWLVDVSASQGENRFLQGTDYSVNVSLGESSPRAADNGELAYQLRQVGAMASGPVPTDLLDEVLLTVGSEWRRERYRISRGDFASYAYGPQDDFSIFISSPLDPCPEETGNVCADGQPRSRAPAGMQAFPGYRLAVSEHRESAAFYGEAELSINPALNLTLASRWESVTDEGRNVTGKLAASWRMVESLYWRMAVSSGFRAPGLNQQSFTHVITNIGADVLTNTLHAAQGNPALLALGFDGLKPERSRHLSTGWVWTPAQDWLVSLDWFRIHLRDAVAMSDVIAAEPDSCVENCHLRDALALQAHNIGAVQFLYNAYDSTVTGADLVVRYQWESDWGRSQLALLGHKNQTEITRLHASENIDPARLFSPAQVMLVETGQPRRRITLSYDWQFAGWAFSGRINRYGSVKTSYFTEAGLGLPVPDDKPQYHKSGQAWLLDADISYQFGWGVTLALGGSNLLNTYPKRLASNSLLSEITGGSFQYPWEASPYGINGAFYYVRTEYRW
ncbi:TonB-dependent receptor [Simiduia agarivorans]|uniref:TonB-dependent receptor n=1 Tax=Simiduia agarivorans TaxID=447471 RepID=UPI000693E3E9|nr:TonB-dependent receptor [Simiduia agarivorans]